MNTQSFRRMMIGSMIALTGTFALAVSAQAGEASTANAPKLDDVVVNFADLDLATREDAQQLYARLSSAAGRACGKAPMAWDRQGRDKWKACRERKLEKAVGKVGNPNVQALHAERKSGSKAG